MRSTGQNICRMYSKYATIAFVIRHFSGKYSVEPSAKFCAHNVATAEPIDKTSNGTFSITSLPALRRLSSVF